MTAKPIADCSSWQGAINYPLLISMTDGVIMRAGNGLTPDVKFAANWAGLSAHPGLLGAYWFVRTDLSAAAQAQKFHDQLGSANPPYLVMDAEADAANLSQAALRMLYKAFLDKLASLRPGSKIAVYTRASYWDPQIGVAGWENSYPLWVAHYTTGAPAIPLAWNGNYWLHQYSADGNNLGSAYGVASDDIDLNKLAVPAPPPVIPPPTVPPPSGFPKSGTVSGVYGVNLRHEPRVASDTLVKNIPKGTAVTLYDELLAVNGNDWYLATVPSMANLAGWVVKYLVTAS